MGKTQKILAAIALIALVGGGLYFSYTSGGNNLQGRLQIVQKATPNTVITPQDVALPTTKVEEKNAVAYTLGSKEQFETVYKGHMGYTATGKVENVSIYNMENSDMVCEAYIEVADGSMKIEIEMEEQGVKIPTVTASNAAMCSSLVDASYEGRKVRVYGSSMGDTQFNSSVTPTYVMRDIVSMHFLQY